MNCRQISEILDSRDVNGLSSAERHTCEEHALSCRDCGPTWVVYTRLAAMPVPSMAPDFMAQCEAIAAQGKVVALRRAPSRWVLVGTILVVAAAATMLSMSWKGVRGGPRVAEVAPVPTAPSTGNISAQLLAPAASEVAPAEKTVKPIEAAVAPFTVRVLPLRNDVADPAGKRVVATMYAAFLDRLRAVPGVTLLALDVDPGASEVSADFQVTIAAEVERGEPPVEGSRYFRGQFRADILLPNGNMRGSSFSGFAVQAVPDCVTDPRSTALEAGMVVCMDAEGVAADLVGRLRKFVFLPDPALRRELQARLLDGKLDVRQRQQALLDLAYFGSANGGRKALMELDRNLRDPAIIRGAIDIATTSSDPSVRATVWGILRGVGDADLVPPLLAALTKDPESEVRLAAVGTLAADFAGEPSVQAAMKRAAVQDSRPLVRALAKRSTEGPDAEAGWKEYVVSSLKDPARPEVERIEALFYQMSLPATSLYRIKSITPFAIERTLALLDDKAMKILGETLPVAASQSPTVQQSSDMLLRSLGVIRRPAVTELLLAILDSGNASLSRPTMTEALGELANSQNDARAYAALEKLTASDPDPEVRAVAEKALKAKPSPSSPPADRPQRLGISLYEMTAGPDVPEDMVGKLMIMDVGPGSVAQKAGLRERDVLLQINGMSVPVGTEMPTMVESLPKGVDIEVVVSRSGETQRLYVRF